MSMELLGSVTLVGFYALFFLVGAWASRRESAGRSSEGLMLAGRTLPVWLGALTMTATWVGGGFINGTAEAVYDSSRGLVWTQAPWGYALSLILGGLFFAGRMRRLGFTTMLDPCQQRFGRRVTAVLFVAAASGEIFWSAAILAALGSTLSAFLDVSFSAAVLISAALAVAYTVRGGLRSVSYTDALQLACILIGLMLALPFALNAAGGWSALWDGYRHDFGLAASLWPPIDSWRPIGLSWGWSWFDSALLLMLGGIPWQVYFQRVLACKDAATARRLSYLAGAGCLLLAAPAALLGAVGTQVDWSAMGGPPAPALVLPAVLRYWTPPLVAALGLGAIAAAVMSSVDSSILSAASLFTWNVVRPFTGGDDSSGFRLLQWTIPLAGLAAALLALQVRSVYALWFLCGDLVYVILFPQLVASLFWRRANPIGSAAGVVVGLIFRLGGGEPLFAIPPLLPYPIEPGSEFTHFPFRTTAMLASLATIWVVSVLTVRWAAPRPLRPVLPT